VLCVFLVLRTTLFTTITLLTMTLTEFKSLILGLLLAILKIISGIMALKATTGAISPKGIQMQPKPVQGLWQTPSDVWDTHYYINEKNIDRYPLVAPLAPPVTPPDGEPADSTFSEFAVVLAVVSILLSVVVIAVGFLVYLNKRQK
jgi:hypothetical protein